MEYTSQFYYECPISEKESEVEVLFETNEEPADVVEFWGFPVAVPANEELEILEVLVEGEEWDGTPEEKVIIKRLYDSDWSPTRMAA